jgi:CHAD domain-containing protein
MSTEATIYARRQTKELLDKLEAYSRVILEDPDADAVHDLRVAIRRFRAALRLFRPEFRRSEVRKIRRRLTEAMDKAGAARDRDIALELFAKAGVPESSELMAALDAQRLESGESLRAVARRWTRRERFKKWAEGLEL